jgi:hypothetical protein
MRWQRLAIGLTVTAAAAHWSGIARSQPAGRDDGGPPRQMPAPPRAGAGNGGGGGAEGGGERRWNFGRIDPDEMQKAMQFLAEVSPNRAALLERAAFASRDGINPLRRQIYIKWRELQVLKEEDAALYAIKLDQMRKEDVMFGEAAAIREARGHGSDDHRQKLYQAATEFVQLRIKEREHLIAKLQAALNFDRNHTEEAVKLRVQRELSGERGGRGLLASPNQEPRQTDSASPPPPKD